MSGIRLFALLLLTVLVLPTFRMLAVERAANPIPKVTIAELLAHRKDFLGKRVEVIGYFVWESPESWPLYQSQEDAKDLRDDRALSIMPFAKRG